MTGFAVNQPTMVSITVGTTALNLLATLRGLGGTLANLPSRASYYSIEYDLAGGGNLYIGNSAVSSSNCGRHLVPTQNQNIYVSPVDSSALCALDAIWVVSDTATQQVNVTVVCFGQQ
jgi:hypothetical protein